MLLVKSICKQKNFFKLPLPSFYFILFSACKHSHLFECINLRCIPAEFRCDGYNDCGDYSDEIIGCIVEPDIISPDKKKETSQAIVSQTTTTPTQSVNDEKTENSKVSTIANEHITKKLYNDFTKSHKVPKSTEASATIFPFTKYQNLNTKWSNVDFCGIGKVCLNGGFCKLNSEFKYFCTCLENFEGLFNFLRFYTINIDTVA